MKTEILKTISIVSGFLLFIIAGASIQTLDFVSFLFLLGIGFVLIYFGFLFSDNKPNE